MSTVLVVGVSRNLGARLARVLRDEPDVRRVIGVDTEPPRGDLGGVEFLRADVRTPVVAKVIDANEVDTVVHMNVLSAPLDAGGRASMKEINVIGTMQLLAACQRAPSMRRLVLRSSTAVYGVSPGDPALFTEDTEPRSMPRSGFSKDAVEVEGYVRGFARRRPDVAVTVLRFANVLGPGVDSALSRYFSLPVIPTVLGFDPRLQFVHEDDGIEVLRRAALGGAPGTFNVAGEGTLLLSQAARRAGRPILPLPSPAAVWAGQVFRGLGLADFTPEQVRLLSYGRVVDIARLRERFSFTPAYTTPETFHDFVRGAGLRPTVPDWPLDRLEELLRSGGDRTAGRA